LLLSLTWTVKLNVPLAEGVPEIAPVPAASANPAGRLPETTDHEYAGVPPVAPSVALYAVPITPAANAVPLIASGRETFVPDDDTIETGTTCDASPVWLFCTCSCAVPGTIRLPLWIEPDSVVASTTEVASLPPFHKITAFEVKLLPVTFIVTVLEPAAIVCGSTALIVGAPICSTTVLPQPTKARQAAIPTPTPIAFKILKKHL
jgi:hypothetical protein